MSQDGGGRGRPRTEERDVGMEVPPRRWRFGASASLPLGGALVCSWTRTMPAVGEGLVRTFRLHSQRPLASTDFFGVVGGRGSSPAPLGRSPCPQLQVTPLLRQERGSGERIVLAAGEEVPGQHHDLAGRGHDRDLGAAAGANPLVESAQGTGSPDGCPRRFDHHASGVCTPLFADRPIGGRLGSGLADTRVQTEISHQFGRGSEALNIPDGSDQRQSGHGVDCRGSS